MNEDKSVDKIHVSPHIREQIKEMNLPKKVYVFDTTLRDGEQTPGVSFTLQEKIKIARQLDKLGIDIIEAGMPVVSEGDYKACKEISKLGLNSEIIGLARINREDINKVIECDMDSIHVFIATSELHMKNKLKMEPAEVLNAITTEIEYAKDHFGDKIEFSAEDATRSDLEFLIKANKTAIEAGATRINIPDTVGTVIPRVYGYIIQKNIEQFPENIRVSLHCHNDFGLATANTLAGVEVGAEQVQTTILGIGERTGNAATEEVVMSLYALYGIKTNINYHNLYETAKLIEQFSGLEIPVNFPMVGNNAFKHESGIHAHAVISNPRTYEPLTPGLIGVPRTDEISDIVEKSIEVGKHTGGHSLGAKLESFGLILNDEQFKEIRRRVKDIGDKGKKVTDMDLYEVAISVIGEVPNEEQTIKLEELSVTCGKNVTPTATVKLRVKINNDWVEKVAAEIGVGPVDASCNALAKVWNSFGYGKLNLTEYHLDAITGGTDALGRVRVRLDDMFGNYINSRAVNPDIVLSSIQAMISGMNRYLMKFKTK
ncbi:MAG: 2-isopropylmalate synthase [Candidatus Lokiarchaeota archaeon]|nr:2-isopropylmalate synthase [Candidatus Lokiarchaeota archaeon]